MSIYDPRDLEAAVDTVIDHLKRIEKLLERLSPPEPTPTKPPCTYFSLPHRSL